LFKYVKRFLDMMKILKMVNGNGCATLWIYATELYA
jgi:hypothetical protein